MYYTAIQIYSRGGFGENFSFNKLYMSYYENNKKRILKKQKERYDSMSFEEKHLYLEKNREYNRLYHIGYRAKGSYMTKKKSEKVLQQRDGKKEQKKKKQLEKKMKKIKIKIKKGKKKVKKIKFEKVGNITLYFD